MQLFQSTPTTSTCGRYYTLKLAYSLSTAWATLGAAKNKGGAQRDPFPHVESLLQYDAKSVGARLEPLGSTEALHHYERLQKQSEDAEQTYGRNCADIASV
jgi:hypothetical protein